MMKAKPSPIPTLRHRLALTAHAAADLTRMMQWAFVAIALYFVAFDTGLQETNPALQGTLYGIAQLTVRAFLGYWFARGCLGRLPKDAHPLAQIARAIIVAGTILAAR